MSETVKLKAALKQLDEAVSNTIYFFDQLSPSDLPTLLTAFAQLKDNKEILDQLTKTIGEQYQRLSYQVIPDALETLGFDSIKTGGRNFIVSTRVNASIPEDKREAANEWIINTAGIPELVVPRVNPKQLSSFASQYFETNGKWPPEDLIKIHKQNYIQVRKA